MPGDKGVVFDTNAFIAWSYIWIAALALQHGLPVLSRDAHFREIDALEVLTW